MNAIRMVPEENYSGEGISRGLARGLIVFFGDQNLTGEGMGIGSIAIKGPDGTCFSRTWQDAADTGALARTFIVDTRMSWSIGGKRSPLLMRWIESAIDIYMRLPSLQRILMAPVLPIRSILGIHPVFETIPPHGQVTVTYRVNGDQVDVSAEIHTPVDTGEIVCLLNEVSAAWFTAAVRDETIVAPPPAWEMIDPQHPPVPLYDPLHGIRFSITPPSLSSPVPARLFWGREHTGDLCWAGFCLELGPFDGLEDLLVAGYSIRFTREGCP
jgi:hypothetical protein